MNLHIQLEDFGCHNQKNIGVRRIADVHQMTSDSPEYARWGSHDDFDGNFFHMKLHLNRGENDVITTINGVVAGYCAHSHRGDYSYWLTFDHKSGALIMVELDREGNEIARANARDYWDCNFCEKAIFGISRANQLV